MAFVLFPTQRPQRLHKDRRRITQSCMRRLRALAKRVLLRQLFKVTNAAGLLTVVALAVAGVARADQMTVFSCHQPSGAVAGSESWDVASTGQGYMYSRETCASGGQGAMEVEVGASPAGFPNYASVAERFAAPGEMSISHYKLVVPESYTYGSEAGIVGQAYVSASDESGGRYDYRNLGAGLWGPHTIERTPSDLVTSLEASASCDGEGGPCPAHTRIALLAVSAAELTLNDEATPEVTNVQGGLLSGGALHGETEVSFTASEPSGPGIYSAWFVIDGQPQTPVLLDTRGGSCVDHGQTSNGTRSFLTPMPCERTLSSSVALNTASLSDGEHAVTVMVDDAAGNSAVVYSGTITTDNAPTVLAEPAISGSAQVGSTLTATRARFATVEGAGSLSAISGQWLRCSDAAGTHCAAIAGATGSTYSPASSDVGYYLLYADSAGDNDGTTISDSQPTVVVTEASNGVAGFGGQSNPISSGVGGSGGIGGSGGGAGSAVTVNVLPPAGGPLGSKTPWQVTLKSSRKRVHRGITLELSGAVPTRPLPGKGKLVYVRARRVLVKHPRRGPLEHVFGPWLAFAVTRTGESGGFTVKHKFKFSGAYLYEFEAVAPAEAGYRNSEGISRPVAVEETSAGSPRKAEKGVARHG